MTSADALPQVADADVLLATGGGSAPAAGVPFAAEIGAYFTAGAMASEILPARLELGGEIAESFRFETEVPVDDLLIWTSAPGRIFFQFKTNMAFGTTEGSEMGKTVNQIVRLWKLCSEGVGNKGWNTPLDQKTDRVVIAVGKETPSTVGYELGEVLKRRRQNSVTDAIPDDLEGALTKFRALIRTAWKTVYGAEATDANVEAILDNVVVMQFTHADFEVGTLILGKNLADEKTDKASFAVLARICEARMQTRTGFNVPQIRRELESKGVKLLAPADYRADQRVLQEHSALVRDRLAAKARLRVNESESVPIPRMVAEVITSVAAAGSLLILGDPGVGKSGVLHNVGTALASDGAPVMILKVEGSTQDDLEGQIGLEHPFRKVLENWPGTGPAYLLIDGLDEARGGPAESVYRALIADVLALPEKRWIVIASGRIFDLRVGVQFRSLFKGSPPSDADREPGESFNQVRHVVVRRWSPTEFEQILEAVPRLQAAIEAGGQKLRELAAVPFNTQLLADVVASGVDEQKLGSIRSQVELLRTYWDYRVRSCGMAAETCLESVVKTTVEKPFKDVALAPIRSANPETLEQLLRQGVLVDVGNGRFLTFQHNILYDYAASRLYLNPFEPDELKKVFSRERSLGLLLGPALSFALKELWETGGNRTLFWKQLINLTGDRGVDAIARCQASRTACELVASPTDVDDLMAQLRNDPRAKKVVDGLVGALMVLVVDAPRLVTIPAWAWATAEFSTDERLDGNTGALLDLLLKQELGITSYNYLGAAARRLLERGFADLSLDRHQLARFCIAYVARTYSSDPAVSRALLEKIFDPARLERYAHVEVPALAREVEHISTTDPGFASEIYKRTFGYNVSSTQETRMGGGNILPMTSNASQDYNMARYSLSQHFSSFLEEDIAAATEAVIAVMEGEK